MGVRFRAMLRPGGGAHSPGDDESTVERQIELIQRIPEHLNQRYIDGDGGRALQLVVVTESRRRRVVAQTWWSARGSALIGQSQKFGRFTTVTATTTTLAVAVCR